MPHYGIYEILINDSNKQEIKHLNEDERRGMLLQDDMQTSKIDGR